MRFIKMKPSEPVVDVINESGYFSEICLKDIAGCEVYAMVDEEKSGWPLAAVVVVVRKGARAFVDFLVVKEEYRGNSLGRKMMMGVKDKLKRQGVRHVNAVISGENGAAMKLAPAFGGVVGFPYMTLTVSLEDDHG